MALSADAFKALQPLEYTKQFLSKGIRPDGRSAVQQRSLSVQEGVSPALRPCASLSGSDTFRVIADYVTSGHGSAVATIGGNSVVATVRGVATVPQEHAPEDGVVEFQVHMTPQCSPDFSPSSTPDEAYALAELLGRLFIRSKVVNLSSLCIAEGKAVWALKVDLLVTSLDGSPLAAAVAAAGQALASTALPSVVVHPATGKAHLAPSSEVLKAEGLSPVTCSVAVGSLPTATSLSRVAGHWLVDPTADEQAIADANVHVGLIRQDDDKAAEPLLCLLHSSGAAGVQADELAECVSTAMGSQAQ